MRKSTLLGTVAAAAIMVVAASDAFATNNDVRGTAGIAKAGNATVVIGVAGAKGHGNTTAGVGTVVNSSAHSAVALDCDLNKVTSNALQSSSAGVAAAATGDRTLAGVGAGSIGGTKTGAVAYDFDNDDGAFAANAGYTLVGAGAFGLSIDTNGNGSEADAGIGQVSAGQSMAEAEKGASIADANASGFAVTDAVAEGNGDLAGAGTIGKSANASVVLAYTYDKDTDPVRCYSLTRCGVRGTTIGHTTAEGFALSGGAAGASAKGVDGQLSRNGSGATAGNSTLAASNLTAHADVDLDETKTVTKRRKHGIPVRWQTGLEANSYADLEGGAYAEATGDYTESKAGLAGVTVTKTKVTAETN